MDQNIIDEIFEQFKISGFNASAINIELFEQQIEILQPRIVGSCIFSEYLSRFDNNHNHLELYHWYNILQNNPTAQEVEAAQSKVQKFLTSFNISALNLKGLSYDMEVVDESEFLSNDFKKDLNNLLNSFAQKPDCEFHRWFKNFRNNILVEDQTKVNEKLTEIFRKYSSNFPLSLEMILSDSPSASSSCAVIVLAEHGDFILREDTIKTLEKHLTLLFTHKNVSGALIEDYLTILINNIIHQHQENQSYAISLSKIITKGDINQMFTNRVIKEFNNIFDNHIETSKAELFAIEVFENFESIINKIANKEPVLKFIGEAVTNGLYKINHNSFEYFELLLSSQNQLRDLAFEVVCIYLHDVFSKEKPDYNFLQHKIENILESGYKLPSDLLNNIINAYSKDTHYFSDALVRMIKLYYNDQKILKNLAKTILKIVQTNDNLDNQSIKELGFIIGRLFDAGVLLPDILTNFVKFIKHDDTVIQKQVIKLYEKLEKFSDPINEDHIDLLTLQANIIEFLENDNIEVKYGLLENLVNLTSEDNTEKLEKIFKSAILLQNNKLLPLALDGLNKCKRFQQEKSAKLISLNKQELSIIWASSNSRLHEQVANLLDTTEDDLFEIFINEKSHSNIESDLEKLEKIYSQYYIYNNSNNLAEILKELLPEDVIITNDDIRMIAARLLPTDYDLNNLSLRDTILEKIQLFQNLLANIEFKSISSLIEILKFIDLNEITFQEVLDGLDSALSDSSYEYNNDRTQIWQFYKGLINNLIYSLDIDLSISDQKAYYRSINYLVDFLNWPADILYNIIKKTPQQDFLTLIINLEKLADYSVNPDVTNRKIQTALEILQNTPLNEWLVKLHSLITDNRFFIGRNRGELLEKIAELNKNNPRILDLIDSGYFDQTLDQVEKIKNDWLGFKYEIMIDQPKFEISDISDKSTNTFINYQDKIYLYEQNDAQIQNKTICLASEYKTACLKESDLSKDDFSKLLRLILVKDQSKSLKKDLDFIYELAVKFDISPKLHGIYKPLYQWTKDDFSKWRQNIGKQENKNMASLVDDHNIAEILAVLSEAAHDTTLSSRKAYPREIQLLAVLSLFKSATGGLAQIATSEGKSLIVSIFSAIKVISGIRPDVMTSSSVLVVRDIKKEKPFYDLFGITIDHNIRPGRESKTCYLADIVYGDPMSFIGDSIRDITSNVKFGRGYELLVIDEADNLFIDQNSMKIQLSSTIPGFNILRYLLSNMWSTATSSFTHYGLFQDENYCYYNRSILSFTQQEAAKNLDLSTIENPQYNYEIVPVGANCFDDFIRDYIANYTQNELFAFKRDVEYRKIIIPKHLETFSQDQLVNWLDSILASYLHQEKHDYIVHNSTRYHGNLIIAPVDYKNTGDIQESLRWDNGRHPYLEVKHALTMHSESLTSIFMSYLRYFLKYKDSIYGVTGTLGTEAHHQFLKEMYNVELTTIPTFIEKDFVEFKPIIVNSKIRWQEEVIGAIIRKVLGCKRAGLVIIEKISEAENFAKLLTQVGYDPKLIKIYGTGAKDEAKLVEEKLKPNEIIISTNMGGRGTDLGLEKEVIDAGGLIVIMTILPASSRVQDQDFGRSARAGEPGSAMLIINTEQFSDKQCGVDLRCLIKERDNSEIKLLNHDLLCKTPGIMMRDKLFEEYVELFKDANSPTGYKLITRDDGDCSNHKTNVKTICLYQDKKTLVTMLQIHNVINNVDEQYPSISISDIVDVIDPKIGAHLTSILSKNGSSVSSLNKQDYELIHFLAANNGFSDNPVIIARVKKSFDQARKRELPEEYKEKVSGVMGMFVDAQNTQEAYLKWLLHENPDFADLKDESPLEANKNNNKDQDKILLEKVKLRKLYLLWIKDRELYNNEYEILQMTEYWATWLKKQAGLFDKYDDCEIATEEEVRANKELQITLEKELRAAFDLFKTNIERRANITNTADADHLMKNPTYLILKAWRYLQIDALQKRDETNSLEKLGILEQEQQEQQDQPDQKEKIGQKGKTGNDNWFGFFKKIIKSATSVVQNVITGFSSSKFNNYEVNNPLQDAKKFVQQAIDLDKNQTNYNSWVSYNAMSFIRLLHDGQGIYDIEQAQDAANVKQQFIYDTQDAINAIQDYVIPQLEAQLTQLLALKFVNYEDDLAIQLIGNIEVYKKIIEALYANAEAVSNSSGEDAAQLGEHVPLEELVRNINITEAVINASIAYKDVLGRSELSNITN